jgi:hypothetical protein
VIKIFGGIMKSSTIKASAFIGLTAALGNVALADSIGEPGRNTVDVKKATYTNTIGDTQLSVVWTDPDFTAGLPAVYYVRVLEIPTPRWSTYDSARNNLPLSPHVPASIQERAWSSPIWYTPDA